MKFNKTLELVVVCALVAAWLNACGTAPTTTEQHPAEAVASSAQQVPIPTSAAQVPGPAAGTAMTKEYVQTVGRMAYLWGWALVNSHNRRVGFGKAPELGLVGGIIPAAPIGQVAMLTDYISPDETFVTCPNQDVVYGAGYFALNKDPVVFQVPDFGDRFWVYALYDGRTDEFGQIGKAYGTKPGFYLIVGPDWKGTTPAGINAVVRSSTDLGFAAPFISAGEFFKDVVLLPYHMGTDPCRHEECSAGYCLPGDPVPLLCYPPELSLTGATAEAGVVLGLIAIFP